MIFPYALLSVCLVAFMIWMQIVNASLRSDLNDMREARDRIASDHKASDARYHQERSDRRDSDDAWHAGASLQSRLADLDGGPEVTLHLEAEDYNVIGLLHVPDNVALTWDVAPNFNVYDPEFVSEPSTEVKS